MQTNTLWLAREGVTHTAIDVLKQDLGPRSLDNLVSLQLTNRFTHWRCELWRLTDTNSAVTLMQKYHPRYFSTHYPPGS